MFSREANLPSFGIHLIVVKHHHSETVVIFQIQSYCKECQATKFGRQNFLEGKSFCSHFVPFLHRYSCSGVSGSHSERPPPCTPLQGNCQPPQAGLGPSAVTLHPLLATAPLLPPKAEQHLLQKWPLSWLSLCKGKHTCKASTD